MFDPLTAAIGIGGSLISGGLGLFGSSQEADAARQASDAQLRAAREAAGQQERQFQQTRSDLAPYRGTGAEALRGLGGVGLGGQYDLSSQYDPYQQYQQSQGLPQFQEFGIDPLTAYQQQTKPFEFDPASDPGYQFRLQQGTDALERSAAARGGLFSGQTGRDLTDYAQGLASQEYQNAYARDLAQKQQLGQAYGQSFGQNLAQQQAMFGQDLAGRQFGSGEFYRALSSDAAQKQDAYNRLLGVAGLGQSAAAQTGQFGQQATNQMGQLGMQGAQAYGAGQLGQAGAWSGGLQNLGNQLGGLAGTFMNYNMMQNLMPRPTLGPAF